MKSETFSRKSIVHQISTRYVPVELTGTANPELARKLKVRVYPTTVLISPRGEVVDIMHGFKSPAAFTKQLAAANSKIMASRAASKSAAPIR
jgi:thioredoxin-related protein